MAANEPIIGNLRWGLVLEVLDKMAEDVALAYVRRSSSEAKVVTAAIDDIVLHTPADITQDLHLHARINYVGRSSMEVGIRIDQDTPAKQPLASSYFTMVARSGEGSAVQRLPLKPLECVDAQEKLRHAAAIQRREAYRSRIDGAGEPPSPLEYQLLAELHAAQEHPAFDGLLAGNLVRSSLERMYPEQENVPQKIFGGYLVRRAFELALMHAEEVAPHRPVIVRINRINFLQPVRIGDKLHFTSRIVYSGRTSLCVEVNIERTSLDKVTKALSNTCVFTFVNVNSMMQPQPVPKVYPTTYAEDARYLEAYRRRLQTVEPAEVGAVRS